MSTFEYYMKEDVFHDSHTARHPHHQMSSGKEATLVIDRPLHKESKVTTKFYSEFDEYLMENGASVEPVTNGRHHELPEQGLFPVKLRHDDIKLKLDLICLNKVKKYHSRSNTTTVTYSVPSTFEVSYRDNQDTKLVHGLVNASFSMVDGKMYDRDFIYYKESAFDSLWKPMCPLKITQPELKTNTTTKRIVPLRIASLTSPPVVNPTWWWGGYWYDKCGPSLPRHGILQHDSVWSYESGKVVFNDLHVDLGSPQHITHIGTVGSYPPTEMYPTLPVKSEHTLYCSRNDSKVKARHQRQKYSKSIVTSMNPCDQSWPVSYRLYYKCTAGDNYQCLGNFKANSNSYDLTVNDVSHALAGIQVRFLRLQIQSSCPYYWKGKYSHPVKMSIAVYGPNTTVRPTVMKSDGSCCSSSRSSINNGGEPALVQYTLSIPKPRKNQYEVKQRSVSVFRSSSSSVGSGSKLMGKRSLLLSAAVEAEEFKRSPEYVGENEEYLKEEEDHCYTSAEEDEKETAAAIAAVSRAEAEEEQLQLDLLLNVTTGDSSFWDPVIPYELQQGSLSLEDESQWPALPSVATTAATTAVLLTCQSIDSESDGSTVIVTDSDSIRSDGDDWMMI